jgi:diadenosine tetraphosphate (Ap4A) HIT family hydrolase
MHDAHIKNCDFCELLFENQKIVDQNGFSYAILSSSPIASFHYLIIPKRHEENWLNLASEEVVAIHSLATEIDRQIKREDSKITGCNLIINVGSNAGQTVGHAHMHVIGRYKGDMAEAEEQRGAVTGLKRLLIPVK